MHSPSVKAKLSILEKQKNLKAEAIEDQVQSLSDTEYEKQYRNLAKDFEARSVEILAQDTKQAFLQQSLIYKNS
jgi:hypothetical protein